MNKKCIGLIISCFSIITVSSQTLFTYGNQAVDVKEFLKAYAKNNTKPVSNKAKSINDYLELYIKSRLKIREAYERRYDTLPQITSEVNTLRVQIIDNYMADPEIMPRLQKEAFQRSQKDVRVAHIFVSYKNANGVVDTIAAQQKKDAILQRLQKGEDFSLVAQQNSDDPAAKNNKGDLGYITVFTLPYEFENSIYSTPAGKYSSPVKSKIGYHIFKNTGERKAVGKIKAQQLLLAVPPGTDEASAKKIAALADSLYKRLLAGDDFSKLATTFSNDYISAATGGNMPDIGIGQYDPAFENALWSLLKDGAISKPFLTSHGWHIVKRISVKPVITNAENKSNQQELQQKIMADSRWKSSGNFIYDRVMKKGLYKKYPYDNAALWAAADSLLDLKPMKDIGRSVNDGTLLFSIGNSTYTVEDWIAYTRTNRFKADGTGAKSYELLMEEFRNLAITNYYREHLEDFNDEFRDQMTEFRDGNLFFEIMQQEIWNKAQSDSAALLVLYNRDKKNYTWNQSADAVIFFCADQLVAKTVYDGVKKNPADWRKITAGLTEKVVTDSSRYTWDQLPNLNKVIPKAGMITPLLVNTADNTASFAYIIKVYTQPLQRSFDEARGLVINDYQDILEKEWNEVLKKKYPVVIDQRVLSQISK